MKFLKSFALIAAMTLVFATSVAAAPAQPGMIPKINSFDFLVDYSGSMMMTNNASGMLTKTVSKMDIAKQALQRVNKKIPALGYSGGMHVFAPVSEILQQSTYNEGVMAQAINKLKGDLGIEGRITPMGDGIGELTSPYNRMSRKAGVIMVTDGNSNYGSDPVAQVTALYSSNPDICLHVISLADTKEGADTLKQIAAMRKCSAIVEAAELIRSDAAVDKFVEDVFYTRGKDSGIVLRSVQFPFDSAVITDESAVILDEVAKMLKASPRSLEISGHTCSIGSADYNLGLSQRRANAVKNYLVKKGVPASSLTTAGKGLTEPKYDNRTEEGRRLNRRAEIK